MQNFGLIETIPTGKEMVFGEVKLRSAIIETHDNTRTWLEYAPKFEPQKKEFDTFGCVSFSMLNCLETFSKKVYRLPWNKSDRYIVVLSDTQPFVGNTFKKVAEAVKTYGLVNERACPWQADIEDYFKPINEKTTRMGKRWLTRWKPQSEWIDWNGCDPYTLWEGLQYAPLQVTVCAWKAPNSKGVYTYKDKNTNHAVELIAAEYEKYFWVVDHYLQELKQLSWDFYFGSAMKHTLKKI